MTTRFNTLFNVHICRNCQYSLKKYETISKTTAIKEYKLKQDDLEKLEYCDESNPHGGPMRRYLLSQVQALARKRPDAFASSDWAARASEVRKAATDDFLELLRIGNLDPARHLRFADWSGISFRDCDLSGCDFTGARLHNCDFTDALIDGARFDQAEIRGTNMRAARDWDAHARHWTPPQKAARNADRSLPLFEPFQDAPFAPQMVVVPAGEFMMGSPADEPWRESAEGPQHKVVIGHPFAVGRYAVTFEEWNFAQRDNAWASVTGTKPRKPKDQKWGRGRRPVIDVSWDDAKAYATWLAHRTGQPYRLLSEAEWEYAARAGTPTPFWWGSSITPDQANYEGKNVYEGGGTKGEYRGKTLPVDSFEPNPWGLYQVHGNVWEWCEDVWHDSYTDKPEELKLTGGAWTIGDSVSRVLRGGSWSGFPRSLRAAIRFRNGPGFRYYDIGFRLARTLNP